MQYDVKSGMNVKNITLPSGGSCHGVAYDGVLKKLFALYQTTQDQVWVTDCTSGTMVNKIMMNVTGSVYRSYYGVTTHHYSMMIQPDDHTKPLELIFVDTTTFTVYKQSAVQPGYYPASYAIDYVNHNVWTVWWNSTANAWDFGIVHMNGTIQEIRSSTAFYAQAGAAATVDITNGFYYTSLYSGSTAYYAQFKLSTGMLVVNPVKWDNQALAYSLDNLFDWV